MKFIKFPTKNHKKTYFIIIYHDFIIKNKYIFMSKYLPLCVFIITYI